MRRLIIAAAGALGACSTAGAPAPTPQPSGAPPPPPAAPIVTIELATAPGLSGLTAAPDGTLWTVAERDGAAYHVSLDGDRLVSLTRVPLDPAPRADLEAVEVTSTTGATRFVFGLEGHDADSAAVAVGELAADDRRIAVAAPTPLPAGPHRVVEANKGVEGLCGRDGILVVAFETPIVADGVRWGQVELHRDGAITQHRVRLTSATGKLAGVDCRVDDTGVDVLAIERHFEVSHLIGFRLELAAPPGDVDATVVRDLAELAAGRNFEGLARLPDGRIALVNDNQYRTVDGASQLVILSPAAP